MRLKTFDEFCNDAAFDDRPEIRIALRGLWDAGKAEGIKEERQRAADTAWEMQMKDFGGGTAIGNAIQEGRHVKRTT